MAPLSTHTGTTIVVIGAGVRTRSIAMFEHMHSMGLRTVVVEEPGAWLVEPEQLGVVHALVLVEGLRAAPQDEELSCRVIRALAAAGVHHVDGVFNSFNKFLVLSSLVAHSLGCICNDRSTVERCVMKNQTRACLIACGLERWLSISVADAAELALAADQMTYPAVLKPASGSGSVGVVRVESAEDAMRAYAKVSEKNGGVFILEEYVDGPEFGVEVVMQQGEVVFCSVMECAKQSDSRWFQGTGRSFPSHQGPMVEDLVALHCAAAVKALGLTTGVLDMDVRYSARTGVRILEVNARMGGGSVRAMHSLVYGIDLVEVDVKVALGVSVAELRAAAPSFPGACFEVGWVMSPYAGTIKKAREFAGDLLAAFPELVSVEPLVDDGSDVRGYEDDDVPSSLVQVIAKGLRASVAQEALGRALALAEQRISALVDGAASSPMHRARGPSAAAFPQAFSATWPTVLPAIEAHAEAPSCGCVSVPVMAAGSSLLQIASM